MTNDQSSGGVGLSFSIGQVERETGLSKDTLRVWERRYGFPRPARDDSGERVYDAAELDKLRVIKRLLDAGFRPARLVDMSLSELLEVGAPPAGIRHRIEDEGTFDELLSLLRSHDTASLETQLSQRLFREGLQKFVLQTIAPLNVAVGESWVRGELAVYEEHLYTELVQGILRSAVRAIPRRADGPRVLLTTLPNELHGLGLLMVETLLATEQVPCIPLGTQTPMTEIVSAAVAHQADVVALSFSAAFPLRGAQSGVTALHQSLAGRAELWLGGSLVSRLRDLPPAVVRLQNLDDVFNALARWRLGHHSGQAPAR
jgi:DNA-binding transcriptional MerR regulator/methylmalonyl-CoA mutase cobalamin-binding subunit